MTMHKKESIVRVLGWRLKHPYPIGPKGCFSIPGMGGFEMDKAKSYRLGSGVAPQAPMPLYPIGQQRGFWMPGMGGFEMDKAKRYCLHQILFGFTPGQLSVFLKQRD